jgi:predicted transcriptional regulator YheO
MATGKKRAGVQPAGALNKHTSQELLAKSKGFADGVAALFFPYAEIVVHDLRRQCVAYIANNLSRRKIGDDSALERAELSAKDPVIGPYAKRNYDGATMRSVSIVVNNSAGKAIGLVCINLNIGVFEQAHAALEQFVSGARLTRQPQAIFQDDWQERINTFIHAWLGERRAALNLLTREQKRALVQELFASGAFNGRSAAEYIARILNMGRATVFKHVKALKEVEESRSGFRS